MQAMTRHWYHGTAHDFETFDTAFLGVGNDELGSGFYFTDNEDTARNYAVRGDGGRIIIAELNMANPMPADATLTFTQIEGLLRAAPDFDDLISNWGEVGFETEAVVLRRAVSSYLSMSQGADDQLDVLNAISSDMWPGSEAAFLETAMKITGYDGLLRSKGSETHAVAWSVKQISIVEIRSIPNLISP